MTTTPETRVTPAMVNAAWSKGKDLRMTGLPTDFREVLEAAMAVATDVSLSAEELREARARGEGRFNSNAPSAPDLPQEFFDKATVVVPAPAAPAPHHIDVASLEIARQHTPDNDPQRRAALQVAIVDAVQRFSRPAAPVPEPVGEVFYWEDGEIDVLWSGQRPPFGTALYAAPPAPVAASAVDGTFDGTVDADSPLQAAAREAGWALGCVIDQIDWDKRGQVDGIITRLAHALDATPPSPNPVADNPAGDPVVNALDPDMPAQEMRLHMGELSAQEMRAARAAIRWANSRRVLACLEPGAGDGWRSIDSAPKDGSEILLTDGQTVGSGFWSDASGAKRADAGWFWESDRDNLLIAKNAHGVTRWSPMPPPPAAEGSR